MNTTDTPSFNQLKDAANRLSRAATLLRALPTALSRGRPEARLKSLERASEALRAGGLQEAAEALKNLRGELTERGERQRSARREELLAAARTAGLPAKRLGDEDRIGLTTVQYRGDDVTVLLGREELFRLRAPSGEELCVRIREHVKRLETLPFSRDGFFRDLTLAYGAARAVWPNTPDGYVPLAALYEAMQFVRAVVPTRRAAKGYPRAQFVYDLMRFLDEGVEHQGQRLQIRTPTGDRAADAMIIPDRSGPLDTVGHVALDARIVKGSSS